VYVVDRPREQAGADLFRTGPVPASMVSVYFARHFSVHDHDRLVLDTPTGPLETEIVGIMNDFASPEGTVYLARSVYEKAWLDPLVTMFAVKANPGVDVMTLRHDIDTHLDKRWGIVTTSSATFRDETRKMLDDSFAYARAVEMTALLVSFFGLFNATVASILSR